MKRLLLAAVATLALAATPAHALEVGEEVLFPTPAGIGCTDISEARAKLQSGLNLEAQLRGPGLFPYRALGPLCVAIGGAYQNNDQWWRVKDKTKTQWSGRDHAWFCLDPVAKFATGNGSGEPCYWIYLRDQNQ
jgi:hypothetical protein